jgi:hypothetical protein
MNGPAGFRLRLRVRIGKALTSNELSLSAKLAGREVAVKSQIKDQLLSEATWIVLGARGFVTESDARRFGEQLRVMVEIAALCSRLGTDVGQDKPSGWVNEEFARSKGLSAPHERSMPNIHGLMILPDDDNSRFPLIEVQAVVTADPAQLLGAMTELAEQLPLRSSAADIGIRMLNFALMSSQPLAQIVLAFSAIEALGQEEIWTKAQSELIEKLAAEVEEEKGSVDRFERSEVADALRRSLHRIGLRQGVLRVLSRLGLNNLRKDWDRLYGLRSGVFHGTVTLTEQEVSQLAMDSVSLCGRIILTIVERDGIKLPFIASVHFPGV